MHQNRAFDFHDIILLRRSAVERHSSRNIGPKPNRQRIRYAAAVTKSGDADFPGAVRTGLQPCRGGYEIFGHLLAVDLLEHLTALVVVAGKTAERGQPVGCECHEVCERESPGN